MSFFGIKEIFELVKAVNLCSIVDNKIVESVDITTGQGKKFMFLFPDDIVKNYGAGKCPDADKLSDICNGKASKRCPDAYKITIQEIGNHHYLEKIRNHCNYIFELSSVYALYSGKTELKPKSKPSSIPEDTYCKYKNMPERTVTQNKILNDFKEVINTKINEIFSDAHFKDPEIQERFKLYLKNRPEDAFAILCALALLDDYDLRDEEEVKLKQKILIKNILDFFGMFNAKQVYYEALWKSHYLGSSKDKKKTKLPLIDYYNLPLIENSEGSEIVTPFSSFEEERVKYVIAESGFGKSTLLDIILLCNIFESFEGWNSEVHISPEQRVKLNNLKTNLFGEKTTPFFPVFIRSEKINDLANFVNESSIIELADSRNIQGFSDIINDAEEKGELLFLIDSIDEIEEKKLSTFLNVLKCALLEKYPNALFVQVSRPLGKSVKYSYEQLSIRRLSRENIYKIIEDISKEEDLLSEMKEVFGKNEDLFSLAQNPLMLFKIIDYRDCDFSTIIKNIVFSIIGNRWRRIDYTVDDERDVILLLGYLALYFIFEREDNLDLQIIHKIILKAWDEFLDYEVAFKATKEQVRIFFSSLPSQSGILIIDKDENIGDEQEKYVFQDPTIMRWMAAKCFSVIMDAANETEDTAEALFHNADWISKFIENKQKGKRELSEDEVQMLVFCSVLLYESGHKHMQKGIKAFLRGTMDNLSDDVNEKQCISKGLELIESGTYGRSF